MPTCFMLVGPPAAGKSTWLSKQEGFHVGDMGIRYIGDTPILSSDDLIEKVAALEGKTYDEVFRTAIVDANNQFFEDIIACAGGDIYIDRTNMSRRARKTIFDAVGNSYRYVAIVFAKPDDAEWVRRLQSREGKTIPGYVLRGMLSSFQMPTTEEGFDDVIVVETEND